MYLRKTGPVDFWMGILAIDTTLPLQALLYHRPFIENLLKVPVTASQEIIE